MALDPTTSPRYEMRIRRRNIVPFVDGVGVSPTVLDVGCGSGHPVIRIARGEPRVDGFRFVRASASAPLFDDGPIDSVASRLTFHEVLHYAVLLTGTKS